MGVLGHLFRRQEKVDMPIAQSKNKELQGNHRQTALPCSNPEALRLHYHSSGDGRLGETAGLLKDFHARNSASLQAPMKKDQVVQLKPIGVYPQYAAIHRGNSDTKNISDYFAQFIKPEENMLQKIVDTWSNSYDVSKIVFRNRARILVQQIRQYDSFAFSSRLLSLEQSIITLENEIEAGFLNDYVKMENESIYPESTETNANTSLNVRQTFLQNPALTQPTPDQLDGTDYLPNVARITFTEFRQRFQTMPGLLNLMNQIYFQWLTGRVLDRRSNVEKAARADTPDAPGGIRCVHTDTNPGNRIVPNLGYQLPPPQAHAAAPVLPGGGQAYHDHVTQYALYTTGDGVKIRDTGIINARVRGSGKFAVEYSGIPFAGELHPHNNKIVFNYLTGDMDVTFNHYRVMVRVDMTH